mgnify:CR=1 FL=1
MNDLIHVCCCTDHNYLPFAGTMILSVCENSNKTDKIVFHVVIGNDISEKDKKDLENVITQYDGFSIKFYLFQEKKEVIDKLPVKVPGTPQHITIASYYRLFLSKILPESVTKVLYLDCDLIVRKSLKDLFDTDISSYSVAGCIDMLDYFKNTFSRLNFCYDQRYINAGVLLINLDYWRYNHLIDKFLEVVVENKEDLVFHDQDVINKVCCNTKFFFPCKWNVQDTYMYKTLNVRTDMADEVLEAVKEPSIIHYTNKFKPWVRWCQHPYKNEFFFYWEKTIWRDKPLLPSPDGYLKHIVRLILQKLGVINKYK